jgi:hypothetical protein
LSWYGVCITSNTDKSYTGRAEEIRLKESPCENKEPETISWLDSAVVEKLEKVPVTMVSTTESFMIDEEEYAGVSPSTRGKWQREAAETVGQLRSPQFLATDALKEDCNLLRINDEENDIPTTGALKPHASWYACRLMIAIGTHAEIQHVRFLENSKENRVSLI